MLQIRFSFLLLLFLCSSFFASAQEDKGIVLVSGVITSSEKEILSHATVMLCADSLGNNIIGYSISDERGIFTIRGIKPLTGKSWLIARSIGYETLVCELHKFPVQLDLVMEIDPQGLETVVVTVRSQDVVSKNDTLIFNSQNFRVGNEKNIGEVIGKMPGMQVDAEGNVSFQGKKINKLLIDGDDIAGSPSLALNTLSADFSNSIELIRDYSEDKLTKKFRSGEELALNLKSARKTQISGVMDLGYGAKDRYLLRLPLLIRMSKISLSANIAANNTGASLLSKDDYFLSKVLEFNLEASSVVRNILSEEEREMLYPPDNEKRRRTELININANWNPSKKYILRTNVLYNATKAFGGAYGNVEQFLPDGRLIYTSEEEEQRRHNLFSMDMRHKWTPNEAWLVKAQTSLQIRNANKLQFHDIAYNTTKIHSETDLLNQFFSIGQSFNLSAAAFGDGLLSLNTSAHFRRGNSDFDLHSSDTILPPNLLYIDNALEMPYFYDSRIKKTKTNLSLGILLIYPIYKNTFMQIESGWQIAKEKDSPSVVLPTLQTQIMEWNRLHAAVSFFKKTGLLRYNIGIRGGSCNLSKSSRNIPIVDKTFFEPHLMLALQFEQNHRLESSISYNVIPIQMEYFSQNTMIQSFSSVKLPSMLDQVYERKMNALFTYYYVSLYNRLFIILSGIYEKQENKQLLVTRNQGLITEMFFSNGGTLEIISPNLYINKGIGALPLDAKLQGRFMHSNYNFVHNRQADICFNNKTECSLSFSSRFHSFPVNFEIGTTIDHITTKFSHSKSHSHTREIGLRGKLHWSYKKCFASVTGYTNTLSLNGEKRILRDIELQAKYRLSSKIELSLSGKDIFHLCKNEWGIEILSPSSYFSKHYSRMPGHLLLSLNYTL